MCRKREKAAPRLLIKSRFTHFISQLYYNTSVNSLSQLSAYSKKTHTERPVVSTWDSAIYGAIKQVPHTCLFNYEEINEITQKRQSN